MPEGVGKLAVGERYLAANVEVERDGSLGLQPFERNTFEERIGRARSLQQTVNCFVDALVEPGLFEPHSRCQKLRHIPVALGFPKRLDGWGVVLQEAMAIPAMEIGLLQLRGRGQHDVGVECRIGHEEFMNDGEEIVTHRPLIISGAFGVEVTGFALKT